MPWFKAWQGVIGPHHYVLAQRLSVPLPLGITSDRRAPSDDGLQMCEAMGLRRLPEPTMT